MLLRFGVENYLSIFERQELSFVATSLKDDDRFLIRTDLAPSGCLVPIAIIYGANASGKSNLLAAMQFMQQAVLASHVLGTPGSGVPRQGFALSDIAAARPTIVDIDFVVEGVRYHFGFEATNQAFIREWLYAFPSGRRQMLYERSGEKEITFGRSLKGRNRVIADLMRENSLFISTAIQNNHEELKRISGFFRSIVFNNVMVVPGAVISAQFKDVEVDQRAIGFLKKIGTGIVGFKRVERHKTDQELTIAKDMATLLKKLNPEVPEAQINKYFSEMAVSINLAHKGDKGEEVFFDPDAESAGTRRLLILVSSIFKALDSGSLIVVDELDASLHTQICEALIAMFSNSEKNPKGAQLIATTHDTNLMRSSILRRDQIWFTEKDEKGASHLFPLSDVQTRRTDNIEKGYLQGRFGAIPFAGPVTTLFGRQ
ncbi:MAG: ATP-binding protein [Methylocella sp.]